MYLRKSMDDDEYQKLSLPSQDFETREFASMTKRHIFTVESDTQTARYPGRPGFNRMLQRIDEGFGFPVGIICWSVDRLSRNPTDDAAIRRLLESGKLADIQFRNFHFENTAMGKFLLTIQNAQATYHVDSLSEGLKRTMREKLRRGQYPGRAHFGWRFNHEIKNIEPKRNEAAFVLNLFKEFSTGAHSLRSVTRWLHEAYKQQGFKRRATLGNTLKMLRNRTYIGLIPWKSTITEGKFTPIVPVPLFEKVQAILDQNRRPRKLRRRHEFPFCGVFRCSCGAMITAQYAKGRRYIYYRCSRKLLASCNEPYVRAEELHREAREKLAPLALPAGWGALLYEMLDRMAGEHKNRNQQRHLEATRQLDEVKQRLGKLVSLHLDASLDDETFQTEQERLILQKSRIKSRLRQSEQEAIASWLEPVREVIQTLQAATDLTSTTDHSVLSAILKRTGTNQRISNHLMHMDLVPPYDSAASLLAEIGTGKSAPELVASFNPSERSLLCRLFDAIRTGCEEIEGQGSAAEGDGSMVP